MSMTAMPFPLLQSRRRLAVPELDEDAKSVGERTERPAAVRARVLLLGRHLGERTTVALVGHEHRVVAEPAVAAWRRRDPAIDRTHRRDLAPIGPARDRDGGEGRAAPMARHP